MTHTQRGTGEPLRCPTDGSRLVELERSGILLDACPECRGVWLDRGELDNILERERRVTSGVRDDDDDFFEEMGGQRSRPREERHREDRRYEDRRYEDDRYRKKKKRRSMLEDLFDFD
jgi:Zn-finger nucleic acid-binding protein